MAIFGQKGHRNYGNQIVHGVGTVQDIETIDVSMMRMTLQTVSCC